MAFSPPTLLSDTGRNNNTAATVSGTISPTGGAVVVVSHAAQGVPTGVTFSVTATFAVTGEWTVFQLEQDPDQSCYLVLAYAVAGSTPGSGEVTVTGSNNTFRSRIHVLEVVGQDLVVQGKTGASTSATPSLTLDSSPSASSMVVGAIASQTDSNDIASGAGFTELTESASTGDTVRLQTQYDVAGAGDNVAWSNVGTTNNVFAAIEISEAGGGGSETGGASLSSGAGGEFSASVVARGARSDSVVGEDSLFASAGAIAVGSSGASLGSSIAALASALASLSGGVAGGDSFIADASASVALSFESVSGSSQLSIAHCIAAIASGIEAGDAWVGQVAALGEISSGVLSSEDASGSTNGSQSAEMVAGVASSEVLAAIAATASNGSLAVESADTSVVAAVIGAVFSDGSASSSAFVSSAAMSATSINSSEAGNELESIASVLAGMMAGAASASDMTFATAVGYLVGVTRLIAALDGVASSRSAVDGDTSLRASLDGLTTLKSD